MGEIREFEECNKFSRRIQEKDKRRRNMKDREEKRKAESSRSRVKSKGREVQERRFTREIYSKNFIWIG